MFRQCRKEALAVMGALGLWACTGTESLEPSAGEVLSPQQGALAGGGVELTTNAIQGTVRYTNENSTITELMDSDSWRYASVYASSTSPGGYSASTSNVTFVNPREYTFEMLVEAGAGGSAGVTYSITAYRGPTYPSNNRWTASNVVVRNRTQQPNPTQATLEVCAGLVRFVGGTDQTCSTPLPLTGLSNGYIATYAKQGIHYGYVPAGYNQSVGLSYTVSTSSGSFSGSKTVTISAACDEIVTVCLPQPPPPVPPPTLANGAITGPWEVIGETAVSQQTYVYGGPRGAYRAISDSTPLAPVGDPTSWWTLDQLPEGSGYQLWTSAYLRSGGDSMQATASYVQNVPVVGNQTTPVSSEVNHQTRYPFVMHPSYFYGSVRLVDPYVTQHPGANSSLSKIYFYDADNNRDGFLDCVTCGTFLNANSTYGGSTYSTLRDRFDPATGQLSSTYEQALLNAYDVSQRWYQNYLSLSFYSYTGDQDPTNHLYGNLYLQQQQNTSTLDAGDRFRIDHEYCFSDVLLEYWTTQGRFFEPSVSVNGQLSGADWRGQTVAYRSWGNFYGTPAAQSNAQPRGAIRLTMPQGTYSLTPSAYMINSAGQVNSANFAPISMQLGCGQRVKIVPPLTVSVSPMQGCAQSSSAPVTGTVRSEPAEVDRIWYRLNDGPEVTLCTNCGRNPQFSFTVPLQACGNSIEVFAFTEGMPEPATGYQQLVWDDPADGPSCAGSYCVNQPPVARCRSVTAPLGSTCGAVEASINDGSFDPDSGDTVTCVQTPGGPYTEGAQRVRLTCTDSTGLTSSCESTVTVRDVTPPVVTCPSSSSASATATDNCTAQPSVSCVEGTPGPQGTPVTCTARDTAGNQASCSYVVASDTEPPELTCPDAVVACGPEGIVSSYTAQVSDDSDGAVSLTCSPEAGAPLPEGVTQATCTATDAAGNQASCSAPVVHIAEGPLAITLLGAQNMTLECGVDTWHDPGAVATEWCSPITVHKYNTGDDDGDGVPGAQDPDDYGPGPATHAEGTYSVQYIAWNAAGTTVSAIRTVTVNDSTPPTLRLRGAAQMTHTCGTAWIDPGVEAQDACYGDVSPTVMKSGYVNGWVPGTYTVTYSLTDSGGNSAPLLTRTVQVANCPW